jgi:hypothetical protein
MLRKNALLRLRCTQSPIAGACPSGAGTTAKGGSVQNVQSLACLSVRCLKTARRLCIPGTRPFTLPYGLRTNAVSLFASYRQRAVYDLEGSLGLPKVIDCPLPRGPRFWPVNFRDFLMNAAFSPFPSFSNRPIVSQSRTKRGPPKNYRHFLIRERLRGPKLLVVLFRFWVRPAFVYTLYARSCSE